jgi:exocyst complex component 8
MAELSQKLPEDLNSIKEKDDARWVNEFADELTVAIALREWDRAVNLVEQGLPSFRHDFTNSNLTPSAP